MRGCEGILWGGVDVEEDCRKRGEVRGDGVREGGKGKGSNGIDGQRYPAEEETRTLMKGWKFLIT